MFVASAPPPNLGPVDLGLSGRGAPNVRPKSPFTGHATGSLVLATIGVAAHDWQASLGHFSAIALFGAGIPVSILMDHTLLARSAWPLIHMVMSIEILLIVASYLALLSRAAWRTEVFVVCMALALGCKTERFGAREESALTQHI